MFEAEVEMTIPFHDVDLMAIAWHGHYVKYFEIARCALLDKMDYGYSKMVASGFAWPVIDMRIRYPAPARFDQQVIIKAKLVEWEQRLKIEYELRDKATSKRLTRGFTVQVAVDMATNEMCLESPAVLVEKIGAVS